MEDLKTKMLSLFQNTYSIGVAVAINYRTEHFVPVSSANTICLLSQATNSLTVHFKWLWNFSNFLIAFSMVFAK